MPIHFRCPDCKKRLGIAKRKAGTITICPHCSEFVTVPMESDGSQAATDGAVDLAEIDDLLNDAEAGSVPAKPERSASPSGEFPNVELMPPAPRIPSPVPVPVPAPPPPREPVIGNRIGQVVVSYRQALLLVILGAILLFVAFIAGYSVGTKDAPSPRVNKNLATPPG